MNILNNLPKDSALNFKVVRFLFYVLFFILIDPSYFLSLSNLPEALWLPTGIFTWLETPLVFSVLSITILSIAWKAFAILAAFGFLYQFSSICFFIITLLMFNTAHNYGYQTHTYMPLVLASFVMAFGGKMKITLMQITFCVVFFSAGLSKLRHGGLDWVFSESMQNILLRSEILYSDTHDWARSFYFNVQLAKQLWLSKVLAGLTILIEIGSPLALFVRPLKPFIICSLLMMQFCIYFLIFVNFRVYACLYIFWIPWDKIYLLFIAAIKNLSQKKISINE